MNEDKKLSIKIAALTGRLEKNDLSLKRRTKNEWIQKPTSQTDDEGE